MTELLVPAHLLILAFTLWQIISADHLGFKWMKGWTKVLDPTLIRKYHKRVWFGLILMIITGITLFLPQRDALISKPQFIIKMGFVFALIVNSFVIGVLQKTATTKTYASLTFKEKVPLLISGSVSTLSWISATICGLFLDSD